MKAILFLNRPDLLNKHNVSGFEISAQKLRNKRIQVVVDWRDRGTVHSFKYVKLYCHGFGAENGQYCSDVTFAFNNKVRYRIGNDRCPIQFTVKLLSPNRSEYCYSHFENTKYGIVVYFDPPNFNDIKNAQSIESEIVS